MSTGNNSAGLLACELARLRIGLRASRIFFFWIQKSWTTPRTLWSGAAGLRVKDVLHDLQIFVSCWDHEARVAGNVAPVTPVRGELVLPWLHMPIAHL